MVYYLDESVTGILQHAAFSCGETYWSRKWIHGVLSNYKALIYFHQRLQRYSSVAHTGRQKWVEQTKSVDDY